MLEFFNWLFRAEYYSISCVVLSLILFLTAIPERRIIFLVLFMEFLICKLAAYWGLKVTDYLDNQAMYFAYFLIQFVAVYALAELSREGFDVPLTLALLISAAAIYNLLMVAPYYGYTVFGFTGEQMYGIYINLLGFIMLLQLIYMLMFNKLIVGGLGRYGRNYTMFIDRVTFCTAMSRLFYNGSKV